MPSSNESSNCRIDWRPSRVLALSLAMLGLLAAFAVMLSDMPMPLAIPASLLAVGWGIVSARRELRRPAQLTSWREPRAVFRGWLVTVSGIDDSGRRHTLHWWPDTLSADARRRLRLAVNPGRSA